MALDVYRKKRHFDVTPEPRGEASRQKGDAFVIQKHDASRLHYDLRLEHGGVMKSWAVTRGPSLVPGEKRLAVHVEDHPLAYNTFEGTIPQGEYGGGTVMLWDRGRWFPEGDPERGFKKGHIKFRLEGERLKGSWHLVRMQKKRGERQEPWLLIKSEDDTARAPDDPDILEENTVSVATGRTMDQIAAGTTQWTRAGGRSEKPAGAAKAAAGGAKTAKTLPRAKAKPPAGAEATTPAARRARTGAPKTSAPSKAKTGARKTGAPSRAKTAAKAKASAQRNTGSTAAEAETAPRKAKIAAPRNARTMAASAVAAVRKTKAAAAPAQRAGDRRRADPLPDFVPPCLASLAEIAPSEPGWIHEIKLDGYRIQARRDRADIRLLTRQALDWKHKFGPIADAVERLPASQALIDGEIVSLQENGLSSFSQLQQDLKDGRTDRMVYFVFDLLHLDGRNLTAEPLAERKQRLAELVRDLPAGTPIRFSEDFQEPGPLMLKHACQLTLEGIISKRAAAPYRSGRSGDWIKTKCADRQEFVVAGYAPSTVDPRAIGALILGYYDDGELKYAGRTGTGYTHQMARDLYKRLQPMRRDRPAFAKVPKEETASRRAVWVDPKLVAEVDFHGWTHGDRVRQASFQGLREDKPPTDIVREVKAPLADAKQPAADSRDAARSAAARQAAERKTGASKTATKKTSRKNAAPEKAAPQKAAPQKAAARKAAPSKTSAAGAGGRPPALPTTIALTNPDRVYWEDDGITKQELVSFYASVWDWMSPHVTGRPLSLVRCPEGATAECFFQKHARAGIDKKRLHMVREPDGDEIISIDDLDGLIALVQAGVLEVHTRGTTIDRLETADRLVFDLDPGPGTDFGDVRNAARDVRKRLADLGLTTFLKTSGGKGLHVVLPIEPAPWDEAKAFARAVAEQMAKDDPARYTATVKKSERNGRIFVDYLRNSREATAVAPYSTRARAHAPVSTPITWEELGALPGADRYTLRNLQQRLSRLRKDPWADIASQRQALPNSRKQ